MNGQIRLTEQGEVISSKYANPEIGRRNLETLMAASLEATLLSTQTPPDAFLEAAAELSNASMAAYRAVVYDMPGFTDYFFAATPISEIAELNIGSRPASRKSTRNIEDLRAIPWSFSWGQSRVTLPGWFGFGSAVEAFLAPDREGGWRCCAACTANGRSSAPCCPTWTWCWPKPIPPWRGATPNWCPTATWRSASSPPSKPSGTARWRCSNDITGITQRLADNPTLARSIRHRFPYITPLNHLQVDLIRRWRAGQTEEKVQRGILISINGVAAGLRNTG